METDIVKIDEKGAVTLPQDVQQSLQLHEGDELVLVEEKNTILLKPIKKSDKKLAEEIYHLKKTAEGWESLARGEGEEWTLKNLQEAMK